MSVDKVIKVGSAGQIEIVVAAGVATVKVSLAAAAGGGEFAGVLKGSASIEVDVSEKELVDALAALAEKAVPALAPEIAAADAMVDANLAAQ